MNHAKAGVLKNQTGKKKEYRIQYYREGGQKTEPDPRTKWQAHCH